MAYVDIPSTADDQDSPLTESLAKAWTGNCIAIAGHDTSGDTPPSISPEGFIGTGFKAHITSNVTFTGTTSAVVFGTEDYDTNGDYDASTGVYTAPYNGIYQFVFRHSVTVADGFVYFLQVNTGGGYAFAENIYVSTTSGGYNLDSHTIHLSLSNGDLVRPVGLDVGTVGGEIINATMYNNAFSGTTYSSWSGHLVNGVKS